MRTYRKHGPKPVIETTTVLSISMPLWLNMKLIREARERGLGRSALITQIVTAFLGTERPAVINASTTEEAFSPAELADFKRVEDEHRKTMSELLPPPELDPDLKTD